MLLLTPRPRPRRRCALREDEGAQGNILLTASPSAATSPRRSSFWTKYPRRAKCRPLLPPGQRRSPLGSRMQSGRAAGRTYAGVAPNARVRRRGRRSFSPHAACADVVVGDLDLDRTQGASYTYKRTPKTTKQQPFSVMIADSPSPYPYGCRSIPIHGSPSPIDPDTAGRYTGDKACHARFARDGDLAPRACTDEVTSCRLSIPTGPANPAGRSRSMRSTAWTVTCVYP